MKRGIVGFAALWVAVSTTGVTADTIGFHRVTNNNVGNANIGEALFFVDVTNVDLDPIALGVQAGVQFLVRNGYTSGDSTDSGTPIITKVLFDDRTPATINLPITLVENLPGNTYVNFNAIPESGGQSTPSMNFEGFVTTAGFGAIRATGNGENVDSGINRGEALGVRFEYNSGSNFSSVIQALTDGSLRLGLHAQAFPLNGYSEKYISNPAVPVPLPAAVWGGMALLGAVGGIRRFRRHSIDI